MKFSPDPWDRQPDHTFQLSLKKSYKTKIMNAFATNDRVRQLVAVSTHELLKLHVPCIKSFAILSRVLVDVYITCVHVTIF